MSMWEGNWRMHLSGTLDGATFDLERRIEGSIEYYVMKNFVGDNADDWSKVRFFSRGRLFKPWAPRQPLAPFTQANSADFDAKVQEWLGNVTATTLRLEGEFEQVSNSADDPAFEVSLIPVMVTILLAKGAVRGEDNQLRDLAIVVRRSTLFAAQNGPGGGGTDHGDHP